MIFYECFDERFFVTDFLIFVHKRWVLFTHYWLIYAFIIEIPQGIGEGELKIEKNFIFLT